ncbi:MAG: hypothetical protein ABJN57_06385 [Hyphomicrobiales bacterium]
MILKPFKEVSEIDSGNPYKEDISIDATKTIKDITWAFPSHQIFLKDGIESEYVTSSISNETMHVYYNKDGICTGLEIFKPHSLQCENIELLKCSLSSLVKELKIKDIQFDEIDYGIEIPSFGISTYSHDFEENSNLPIDCVYVELRCQ